jgi:hypothetical protein
MRSIALDSRDNLYATRQVDNVRLKFDLGGNATVFAGANDGLNFPAAMKVCRVKYTERKKDKFPK